MNSWITKFLSNDEYKQKQLLAFIAEGVVMQFISALLMYGLHSFYHVDLILVFAVPFVVFIFYTFGRYLLSGIEYTTIFTEEDYKKRKKRIFLFDLPGFVIPFFFLHLFLRQDAPLGEIIGLTITAGIVLIIFNLVSLRRSYKKNKDL